MEHGNGIPCMVNQRSPKSESPDRSSWCRSPVDDAGDDQEAQPLDFSRKSTHQAPIRDLTPSPMPPEPPPQAFMHPFSDVMMSFGTTTAMQTPPATADRKIPANNEPCGILPNILRDSPEPRVQAALNMDSPILMKPSQQPAFPTPFESPRNGSKYTRPFKAYPRDPLSVPLSYYGIPVQIPLTAEALTAQNILSGASEQAYLQFRHQMLITRARAGQDHNHRRSRSVPGVEVDVSSPSMVGRGIKNREDSEGEQTSPENSNSSSAGIPRKPNGITHTHLNGDNRRRGKLPDDLKDEAYWERRRKNNEAAKRSRDARRAKEDEIAIRAAFLEQENIKLRVEITALKNEMSKLRCLLYRS